MAELSPLIGLKAHGTALSFVPPKNICYSRRTRKALTALHRTKEIDLYFRGVAAFRSNQRGSSSNYENPVAVVEENIIDRKSTRLNSSHVAISYAVFCLKKKK